ncbi:nucleolar transcription factor 1 [Sergentomyia squamirostris]
MSTRRGANVRTRPQKHKNTTAFRNDLHDKTPTMKFINSLQVREVCEHCQGVIEWKIKYKKYKPLSQPKTCIKCGNRCVKKAYHVMCTECALKLKVCAKCNKSPEEGGILPPVPTRPEQMKLDAEMQHMIKRLPERKRRTFLRFMKKGKKAASKEGEDLEESQGGNDDSNEIPAEAPQKIPHTREELLEKIQSLKLTEEDDDDYSGSDFDEDDFENDSESSCSQE